LPLIQSFLKEIDSELLEESRKMPLKDICRQMALIDGGKAKRFFNYPYDAIEEALVNAVYHRLC